MNKKWKNESMGYKPILHQINEANVFDILYEYLETWHEMKFSKIDKKINFNKIFEIEVSPEINNLLDFLTNLNFTTVYGKKKYIYNGFEYVFPMQILNITYDKKLGFLSIFKERKSGFDLYYGIKKEDLLKKNPQVNRLFRNNDTKALDFFNDNNLTDFIVYNICWSASKIGVKEYATFLKSDLKIEIESIKKMFKHETKFSNFELFENDDLLAIIDHQEHSYVNEKGEKGINKMDILRINKYEEKEKIITNEIARILNWNGWSNNCLRYKL